MKKIAETDRLTLREFTLDDALFVLGLMNSPGWLEFIGDRNVRSEDAARSYLENGPMKSYRDRGFGLWLVELKDPQIPIGMCGILKRDSLNYPDIGFAFLPEYMRKGYAFEAANATLSLARHTLKFPKIAAITTPTNKASISLLTRLGLKETGSHANGDASPPLLLFEMELAESPAG
jgi:RimJ/RimL family protein N-acetyltransferase